MAGRTPPADDGAGQVAAQHLSVAAAGHVQAGLLAFMFADIRGFTRFTAAHGAEASARLVDAFLSLSAEVVERHGGAVRGTWGDQVLAEFWSPRDAVRAAVELQARCVERTVSDPSVPLGVGIGLDVGEPAREGVHQSAAALNVAARLCSIAAAGEVLATAELVHLAGAQDGLAYADRGGVRLKGLVTRTHVVQVRDGGRDPGQLRTFRAAVACPGRWQRHRRSAMVASCLALVLAIAVAGVMVLRPNTDQTAALPSGGMAVVDLDSGDVVDAVEVGSSPEGVVVADGDLWVAKAASDAVVRIDPSNGRVVQNVGVGDVPVALAATPHDVWVVNSQDGTVSRISTATNQVVDVVVVGNEPVAIAAGFGSLWVANQADGTVTRIGARTGKPTGTAAVGRRPAGVATGGGAVWVTNGRDGTVSAVDPRSLRAEPPIAVGAGPKGITVAPSGVWVANRLDLTVSHVDPVTRREDDKIRVGDAPFAVVGGQGSVWVSASASGTLVQIDGTSRQVVDRVTLRASPYGLSLVEGQLWAATRPFAAASHRGGTLRVIDPWNVPHGYDPAVDASFVWSLVYDGLVGFRRSAGADNFDPVPNLAVALPRATDDGRVYSFQVRSGIRYSDGRLLAAADFRRGIARALTGAKGAGSEEAERFAGILGAQACLDGDAPCDLSAGIRVRGSTVVFRLTAPDPDFLNKLALPFASPAPPGSPAAPATGPMPGTGPYAVAALTPDRLLRLERNKHFHSWSAAARPAGYPDVITFQDVVAGSQVQAVLDGRADLFNMLHAPAEVEKEVALARPAQVRRDQFQFTYWIAFDTVRRPFDQRAARRAVAVAVDREHVAELMQQGQEQAACGLPPPGFPGYDPSCPFAETEGSTRRWTPDLREARRLVARSGTEGMPVEIYWTSFDEPFAAAGRYVARLLHRIGYDARLHLIPYFPPTPDESSDLNVSAIGWTSDLNSAADYYLPMFTCTSPDGNSPGRFCDHRLDALAARAIRLGESDPGAADRLWRTIFAKLRDDAIVVPVTHGGKSTLLSERVGNYQYGNSVGPLYDQMWVR